MKRLLLPILLLAVSPLFADECFRVVSYNVENLFDCDDDPLTLDEDYTPSGKYHWTPSKLRRKCINIARVITAVGEWKGAALVGLCEIESEKSLRMLVRQTPLRNGHYGWIHYESPDARGVDVALLFDSTRFVPLQSHVIRINFPDNPDVKTRDVLYVEGLACGDIPLHLFVCHTPSRLGGEDATEWKRCYVMKQVRGAVDSILRCDGNANIVIMGDFNDYPDNKSITDDLGAKAFDGSSGFRPSSLYNLFYNMHRSGKGSHKMQGEWGMLDQMMVSGAFIGRCSSVVPHIFEAPFILEPDKKYMGMKPFRSFRGPSFTGGFSDHLPIYTDFYLKKEK